MTEVVLVPGWGKSPQSYRGIIEGLKRAGKRVIAYTPSAVDDVNETKGRFPLPQQSRASAILALLAEQSNEPVDVVAHSEGCLNVLIAAQIAPNAFKNFVMHGPPGFSTESYARILYRALLNARDNAIVAASVYGAEQERYAQKVADIQAWVRARRYAVGWVACLTEAMYPGRTSIVDVAQGLHQLGHRIAVVIARNDAMISREPFASSAAPHLGISRVIHVHGNHDVVCISPAESTRVTLETLSAFEQCAP